MTITLNQQNFGMERLNDQGHGKQDYKVKNGSNLKNFNFSVL